MKNKRKYSNTAKNINNYNNFLKCLDKEIVEPTNVINDASNNVINDASNNATNDDTNKIKNDIDELFENIKKKYKTYAINTSAFTGFRANEYFTFDELRDPNDYVDRNELKRKNYKQKNPSLILQIPEYTKYSKNENEPILTTPKCNKDADENKVNVYIDVEVKNIEDLLKIIENYKVDVKIKYNIDIESLHRIKEPLNELNNMIGMKDLKNNIVDQILYFMQGLHKNRDNTGDFLHTVIYGSPGTGKTEIAKIIGKIYSNIGILRKNTFKKVTRSDLIAGYLGQTALKTKDVIKDSLDGVLFIDEAYSLGNNDKKDSFSKECIDTLCEALSDYKEKLMVIIAGYEKELNDCFFNYNQGLDSRFVWRFKTDDYSPEDLLNIFLKKVKDVGWEMHSNSDVTFDWFKKNMDYFKFYGRDIEVFLSKTKIAHSRRVFCKNEESKRKIIKSDLDKGLEMFLKNDNVKNRMEKNAINKIISSMYI